MKTMSLLQAVLPLTLAATALVGCGSQPAKTGDADQGNPTVEPDDNASTPTTPAAPPVSAAPPAAPAAAPPAPPHAPAIATAKVHAAPVWAYAVSNEMVFVTTDTAVER